MNIDDKIDIIKSRIRLIENDIYEHNRILEEDILQDGDEEVIRNSLFNLNASVEALNEHIQVLTNSSIMI